MSGIYFWVCVLFILYVYLGYPLILAMLAKIFPRSLVRKAITPGVTLIIAAHNEEAVIAEKLENSLALDYPKECLQIIVANDGSDDRTGQIVEAYRRRGIETSSDSVRRGKMATINRAVGLARHDIVLFSDANNFYEAGALRELIKPFADPKVGAACGSKRVYKGESQLSEASGLYWEYESFIKEQETQLGSCTGISGEIFALRRELFVPPPEAVINDDFFLPMQIIKQGYRVVYVPSARSFESVAHSTKDEIERRSRIIAGRYQAIGMSGRLLSLRQPLVVWQVVSHKYFRPLVPFAMLGALIANILAVLLPEFRPAALLYLSPPYNWIFLVLQALFYGLALLGRYIKRGELLTRLAYLPAFLLDSNMAAFIGFYRYVTEKQTVIWARASRRTE